MLNSQDALLGPWMPGRDMLEDELRTFVGEAFVAALCETSLKQHRPRTVTWTRV